MFKRHHLSFIPASVIGKWLRVLVTLAGMSLLLVVLWEGKFSAARAVGNTVIASDSFNRTVSNGWGTADLGGSWTVLDTPANWSVAPGAGSISVGATAQDRGVLGSVAVQDVDLLAKIVLPRCSGSGTNCDAYVIGRYTGGSTPSYYRVGTVQGQGRSTVFMRTQRSDGTNVGSDLNTGIAAANGVVLWMRVEFQGINPTTIRGRAWLDGTTEPSTWLLNTTDSTGADQVTGAVGVRARNEDTTASHVFQYESYQATALSGGTPTPTPTPTSTPTLTPTPCGTCGPAAADSFQRTIASGWGSADTGGWWTVVGSPWSWSVSPGAGRVTVGANSEERAYLSSFTIQDVDVVEKVVLPRCGGSSTNCDAFVLGRYAPAYLPTYYRVGLVQGVGRADVFLRAQRSDGTNLGSDLDTGLTAADGVVVWLHVEFQGVNPTAVRARAWLDGTIEPSTWLLNTTDSNSAEQKAGAVGVRLSNEDTSASHSFQVESYQATGTATPVSVTPNPSGSTTAHWVYVVDDGEVYAYDIDNNHALVKQFPIPEAGKRGVAVAPSRGLLYISECGMNTCSGKNGSLLAYDLVHDVVAWIANYSFGVDQFAVTPDGSTIYMPHGADASDGTHSILDASDGQPIGSITTGTNGHNTIVSLDGTQVYLTGYTGSNYNYAHVVNPANNQVILNAGPTVNGIRPFTVNAEDTLMFTTSTNTCGFQVLSLTGGNVLYTIPFGGSCVWNASNAPSHGISLSPDEKRVYVIDAPLDQLEVYDVSGLPGTAPSFVTSVQLSSLSGYESPCQTYCEREGWVLNDLSGRYVYVGDTGDVVDTSTLSVVTTLLALRNTRQVVEIDWTNGTTSATSTRFGLGHGTGSPNPTPTPTVTPTPSPSPTVTVTPTPTPTPGTTLAQDTFQRANQSLWGTASDGQTWGGDANSQSAFSISGNAGLVSKTGSLTYSAVLGPAASNAEVYATGSISSFTNSNFGDVLRWTDGNNWYKAYINGASLIIQKKVSGTTTNLASVPFTATAGTSYTIHFRAVGSTLTANVWASSGPEPSGWMVTVSDSTFTSGYCGMRFLTQSGTATVTSFQAKSL